ncbi:putative ribonuclease H-like domain-containing protein [Tanacetum coccineum]
MEEQSFIAIIHQKSNPDLLQYCLFSCFLSQEEPKKIFDALKDPRWVEAMQEVLLQFKIQNVWVLVDYPKGWHKGILRKMELTINKSLHQTIDEGVYVMQPPGFQDPQFPDRVYKVEKAMYGLQQAPRAWYGTLSKYLLDHGFQRGTIDQTLEFEALMHDKFKMSAMGELSFFLGLQVLQKKDGIFLSQDKYVVDILKKFGLSDIRSVKTPMDRENPWGKDGTGKDVELHLYRSMIGSLMYLTPSRPDIMFAVYACARHQVTPKECHLYDVKRIFRYLKGHPMLGLWYPKDSPFDLVAYSESDYDGDKQDRKSTTGGC